MVQWKMTHLNKLLKISSGTAGTMISTEGSWLIWCFLLSPERKNLAMSSCLKMKSGWKSSSSSKAALQLDLSWTTYNTTLSGMTTLRSRKRLTKVTRRRTFSRPRMPSTEDKLLVLGVSPSTRDLSFATKSIKLAQVTPSGRETGSSSSWITLKFPPLSRRRFPLIKARTSKAESTWPKRLPSKRRKNVRTSKTFRSLCQSDLPKKWTTQMRTTRSKNLFSPRKASKTSWTLP